MSSEQTFEDKLAIQLMECAILVKKGERDNPVVLDTLEKLRHFCQEGSDNNAATTETALTSPTASAKERIHGDKAPVLKPLGNVFGKMIGMAGDEPKKTPAEKKATSEKNAARAKADIAAEINVEHQHHGGSSWLSFMHGSEDSKCDDGILSWQ